MPSTKDYEKLSLDLNRFKKVFQANNGHATFGSVADWGDTFILRRKNMQKEPIDVMEQNIE